MTVVAVAAGQFLALLPSVFMHYLFIGLFLSFGIWLIWKASRMSADDYQPLMEAKAEVQQFEIQESQIWQKRLQKDNSLKVLLEAFSLTFIAEWGDRTQLATMALATTQTAWGVIIGAIAGHTVSTLIAVLGGRWVAGRISERTITWIGGGLFVLFGLIALTQNPSQGATRAILPNI
jgi:putative Ca2+/H+ antiporter (TMEM165/GDT1 family)